MFCFDCYILSEFSPLTLFYVNRQWHVWRVRTAPSEVITSVAGATLANTRTKQATRRACRVRPNERRPTREAHRSTTAMNRNTCLTVRNNLHYMHRLVIGNVDSQFDCDERLSCAVPGRPILAQFDCDMSTVLCGAR